MHRLDRRASVVRALIDRGSIRVLAALDDRDDGTVATLTKEVDALKTKFDEEEKALSALVAEEKLEKAQERKQVIKVQQERDAVALQKESEAMLSGSGAPMLDYDFES
jgi:hypothetical protein